MGEIPDYIMDEASDLLGGILVSSIRINQERMIAKALVAAERRGRDEGMEQAAKIAEQIGEQSIEDAPFVCENVAAAIRAERET